MSVKGNTNAMRHGLRATQLGLTLSRLPAGAGHIRRRVSAFRAALAAELERRGIEVDLYRSALIQTAARWEAVSQLASRWLQLNPDMPPSERLSHTKLVAWGSQQRDATLKQLGLGTDAATRVNDLWKSLYDVPAAPSPSSDRETPKAS